MTRLLRLLSLAGAAAVMLLAVARPARACGCFTPPDPSVPIVQAGERIVFARAGGQVVAHIQIQYSGDAKDFGWLLPLPSIPVLDLGSDELFTRLIATTQPKYRLNYQSGCAGLRSPQFNGAVTDGAPGEKDGTSPLVVQDSIGPYDYAVLKADSRDEMLKWLMDNRYFVPTGTDTAVIPYIHPGGFFLALRLHSGKSAGDIQPVVVTYPSDLPMIPIVLTSVAAQPDMGIQVWMLGDGRAIPRNYFHTVINDAVIDWVNGGANYNDVVIRATHEAEGRHTFVTEYAGTSDVMKNQLDPPGRFGSQSELASQPDALAFVRYLDSHGFGISNGNGGIQVSPAFSGALLAILEANIAYPAKLSAEGVTPAEYYSNLEYYLGSYRQAHPSLFDGVSLTIDAAAMAQEIWKRVVVPTLAAGKLFAAPYLTRLYTTLSPEQMDKDPVFSFNPDLPDVSNVHQATATSNCNFTGDLSGTDIVTEQGFRLHAGGYDQVKPATGVPASLRIEILRESGAPETVTDNSGNIRHALGQDGCSLAPGAASRGGFAGLALLLGALALLARRAPRRRATR